MTEKVKCGEFIDAAPSSPKYPDFMLQNLCDFEYTSAPPTPMTEYYQAMLENQDQDDGLPNPRNDPLGLYFDDFGMSFEDQYGGLDEILQASGLAELPRDEMVKQFVTIVCGAALRHMDS